MKKLIKGALFLAIVGTVIVGCEKEDSPIPTNNQTNNTDSKFFLYPFRKSFNSNIKTNRL